MRQKIISVSKDGDGVEIPGEFLRALELSRGSHVEVSLDSAKKRIVITALKGDEFASHFKDTMDSMA